MKRILYKKQVVVPLLFFIVLCIVCVWYVNDYYRADKSVQVYMQGSDEVAVTEIEEGLFLDGTGDESAVIFYPGGKVEYTAYVPLLMKLAEEGTDCFIVKMPCNLAVFGSNKAEEILKDYDYEKWYMAGHSLGGAMAASFCESHIDEVNGLILLAAYPMGRLDNEDFAVVSIYGSNDKVVNIENLEAGREYMPEDYTEVCIEGGNHAWFGTYGEQDGDGEATISREEQQAQTVDVILDLME